MIAGGTGSYDKVHEQQYGAFGMAEAEPWYGQEEIQCFGV